MLLQNFVAGSTPTIKAAWLNLIDAFYTTLFQGATTAAAARTAIDAASATALAASSGSTLVGTIQAGTGAASRTVQSKERESVSITDFYANGVSGAVVVADSSTDNTLGIQAAIDATPEGGTLLIPNPPIAGHYLYTSLTVSKTITFQGQGWHCGTKEVFGNAGYLSSASVSGSILRSTKTSAGNSITSQTINKGPRFKNLAIIGPGSGTSTGIGFGDGSNYQILGKWDDVLIANFDKGLPLTNVEDYEFSSLRVRGCQTYGILLQSGIAGTNTNQNVFVNPELQKNGIGLSVTEASTAMFYGGLIQGNTTGVKLAPSANGRIGNLGFDVTWFETNTTDIILDLTNGGIQHLTFSRDTFQSGGNFFSLTNPNNNTVSWLTLNGNAASGKAMDFSPGASVGPAYDRVVIDGGNEFSSYTYSNANVINLSDNNLRLTGGSFVVKRSAITYSASMTINSSLGNEFDITATNNTAFTINAPTSSVDGQRITVTIRNTSGGALGAVTWDAVFKMSAWTQPANAFSRSIDFKYNGTNWVQVGQTGVDVPN